MLVDLLCRPQKF